MADASLPHIQVACVVLRKTAAVFGAVVCDGCAAAHVKEGVGSGNIYAAAGVLCVIAADNDVFVQDEISFALDPKATAGAGRAAAGDRAGAINLKIAVDNDDAALIRFRGQRTVNGVIVQIQLDPRVRRNRQRCRPCGRGHVAAERNGAALVERRLQRRPVVCRCAVLGERRQRPEGKDGQNHQYRNKNCKSSFDAVMFHMFILLEIKKLNTSLPQWRSGHTEQPVFSERIRISVRKSVRKSGICVISCRKDGRRNRGSCE